MADTKPKLPKWAFSLLITLGLMLLGTISSLVVYIHERDVNALQENTKAVQNLNTTITRLEGSIHQVRLELSKTDELLIEKYNGLEKRLVRLENE
jgi:uncharacterized protein YpmS